MLSPVFNITGGLSFGVGSDRPPKFQFLPWEGGGGLEVVSTAEPELVLALTILEPSIGSDPNKKAALSCAQTVFSDTTQQNGRHSLQYSTQAISVSYRVVSCFFFLSR